MIYLSRDKQIARCARLQAYRTVLQVDMLPPYNLTGIVEIDMHSAPSTHCVVLHAVGMELDSLTALTSMGAELIGGALVCMLACRHGGAGQALPYAHAFAAPCSRKNCC